MKIQLTIIFVCLSFWATAQVGIGNTDPKASLDITASNAATPSNTDGLLIPRVDEFPVTDPTAAQDGMMVFVTGAGTPSKGFYYWDNTGVSWINVNNGGDSDWYETGDTPPNDINDNMYTYGNVGIGTPTTGNYTNASRTLSIMAENTAAPIDPAFIEIIGNTGMTNSVVGGIHFENLPGSSYGNGIARIEALLNGSTNFAGSLAFFTGDMSGNLLERMRVSDNGSIYIGTENPGGRLYIEGSFILRDGNEGNNKILRSDAFGTASWVNASSIFTDTDNQDLSLTGNTLSLTNDATTVNLSGYLDNTDNQNLTGATLTGTSLQIDIENGSSTSVDLVGLQDGTGTDDQTVDTFNFNTGTNILTLEVENDGLAAQTVDLSTLQDGTGTDNQNLTGATLTGTSLQIDIENGSSTSVDLVGLQDGTGTDNQTIDTFSFNTATNVLTLEVEDDGVAAQTVDLSTLQDGTGTDNQDLSLTANTLSLTNDATTVNLSGYLDNTDNQDLSLSTNTLSLTNDATTVNLSGYLDNTDNQNLTLSTNTLSLTNDATTVDLSGYLDNTDNQNLTGATLTGTSLQIDIQNGSSTTVDLAGLQDGDTQNTLDQAYDEGGAAGSGRTIYATDGAVTIAGEDGFLVTGTLGSGDVAPIGIGIQMFFNPRTASFRSGNYAGSIGNYSTALGTIVTASGVASTALGSTGVASGNYSFSVGYNNTASGTGSMALGYATEATGDYSFSLGQSTTASGSHSFAMGGFGSTASGDHSFSMGTSTASGNYSAAIGVTNTASAIGSIAMGQNNTASGSSSSAFGRENTSPSFSETTLGLFSTEYTPNSTSFHNDTDRIFTVGNGTSNANRSNALTIYKSGLLNINDEYNMPLTDGTVNQIMQTDGAGQVSFVDVSDVSTFAAAKILMSANQSFTGNSWDKINFDTVSFDLTTNFNTTNTRFNVTTAGIYRINASFHSNATSSSTNSFGVAVYVNGSINKRVQMAHYGNGLIQRDISTLIDLAVSDKIEIYIYHTGAITIDSNGGKTSFEIERIR